jgi:hypothetical protein
VIELQPCRLVRLDQGVSRTANRADDAEARRETPPTSVVLPAPSSPSRPMTSAPPLAVRKALPSARPNTRMSSAGRDAHLR